MIKCLFTVVMFGFDWLLQELLPIFSQYGPISSVSFENERHDSALVRYELHRENADDFLGEVRQATNSTKLGDKTIIVEPFRPDSLLFIGNLTSSIDDSSLQSMFDAHGKIERGFVSLYSISISINDITICEIFYMKVLKVASVSLHGYDDRCYEMLKERANAMDLLNTA